LQGNEGLFVFGSIKATLGYIFWLVVGVTVLPQVVASCPGKNKQPEEKKQK